MAAHRRGFTLIPLWRNDIRANVCLGGQAEYQAIGDRVDVSRNGSGTACAVPTHALTPPERGIKAAAVSTS